MIIAWLFKSAILVLVATLQIGILKGTVQERLYKLIIAVVLFCTLDASAQVRRASLVPSTSSRIDIEDIWSSRQSVLEGLSHSLTYLQSPESLRDYRVLQSSFITRERVYASLKRFREILVESVSREEFSAKLIEEFSFYRSVGQDGQGAVRFTGYFRPIYHASRERTSTYRFPIFSKPQDFADWSKPHPTRTMLEGYDGLGVSDGLLRGLELAWLSSRYEAYLLHLQGSGVLEFTDGSRSAVGFAAGTDYPYTGIKPQQLKSFGVAWGELGRFFGTHPQELNRYLETNNRFIFFEEQETENPLGSLGVPVTPERSIATDKLWLPAGAIGVVRTSLPSRDSAGKIVMRQKTRLVFDQDAGSAIKGPGRVDIFMGTGHEAQERANHVSARGELYYLLLKSQSQRLS